MKALIRKSPMNCYEWQEETVMLEPFPQGTDDIGRPYTLEGYRYALCTDVPDGEIVEDDPRLDAKNYFVKEHHYKDDDDVDHTVFTAVYNPEGYTLNI